MPILPVVLLRLLVQGQVTLLLGHLAAEGQEGDDQVEDDEANDGDQSWSWGEQSRALGED